MLTLADAIASSESAARPWTAVSLCRPPGSSAAAPVSGGSSSAVALAALLTLF
ncbi:hypothetical protein [Streptomyces javensis]|uniref:GHMP kinase N-terminal domain-containing protein n=1 Tax=Streptomyces javensis TaxID=114698 RepID=A0ABS0R8S0_9ACTN|nr:hypothetical protein [Streptomyces javensis]MBI0313769.1 hypothetical protein [Streptomyces javensis]